jgi:hypothetical protein
MRKYLSTIHTRSDKHKKNFALAVSSGVTLTIFALWTFINFGNGGVVAQQEVETRVSKNEVSPLESMGASLGSSWAAIRETWGEFTGSFGEVEVDVDSAYEEMKTRTINTYGQ